MEQPTSPTIYYTHSDEAPALATVSLLPIFKAFCQPAGITINSPDISLAGRILAAFSDELPKEKQVEDALENLAELTENPRANIVKLPNISASVPQMKAAIKELQAQGYPLPDYHQAEEKYGKIKGSAVNPVLRQGNSDRRAPNAVKAYARNHPHTMEAWHPDSQTKVACMNGGDFFSNEQSLCFQEDSQVAIELRAHDGSVEQLKAFFNLEKGDILDATFLSKQALCAFYEEKIEEATRDNLLLSLHLKATMMKVSDPILFGHCVKVFLKDFREKHKETLNALSVNFNNGLGELFSKIETLEASQKAALLTDLEKNFTCRPELSMVNSSKGITNLHVPSDVIIDASMPALIRNGGKAWNRQGAMQDTLALIPDASYAGVYAQTIAFCKEYGAFDPTTMGSVPNVGLMAQKAEEYGSHDKTFEISKAGKVCVVNKQGSILLEHDVEAGDIWRACTVKDAAVHNWVELAVSRMRESGMPAVFWLDENRPHDAQLIAKVHATLQELDTEGLDYQILSPSQATWHTLSRLRQGLDTLSVTGNVLRDYLTDLFPILELGTSAKMLSIVPLMAGGGLFETGAGGSAPKHVEQFLAEDYLRWDSLGEFLAMVVCLETLSKQWQLPQAHVLSQTLDRATTRLLLENKSPTRKLGGIDNRGSHFYLAQFWAEALSTQEDDRQLAGVFTPIAKALKEQEERIVSELISVQETQVDMGGYYLPDPSFLRSAMRPSNTFNAIIASI